MALQMEEEGAKAGEMEEEGAQAGEVEEEGAKAGGVEEEGAQAGEMEEEESQSGEMEEEESQAGETVEEGAKAGEKVEEGAKAGEDPEDWHSRRAKKKPRRRRMRFRDQDPVILLSKALSYALRHGAEKLGLTLGADGFADVSEILRLPQFKAYCLDDVKFVVETNKKQRFAVRPSPIHGRLQIRCNQGHSLQVNELELDPLLNPSDFPEVVVHGSYLKHWHTIRRVGLSRMKRTHIHFAMDLPGGKGIVSGIKRNCDLAIIIDVEKALADGILFFRSANGVILTPGDAQGMLLPCYFKEALQLRPHRILLPLE